MKNKHSFQHLLWTIAGAEIPILEKCRTDHKKFGAMGATIAMTSFIAFLSGTSAAWFFTQSGTEESGKIGWAIAFGLVWATLIFCIDRSLVITMKKNPEQKSKTWWLVPFISRALLALIIAFMVSIPLELVVFNDFIEEQSYLWNENKSNTLAKNSRANRESIEAQENIDEGNNSLKQLDSQKQALENEKSSLEQKIANERAKLNNPATSAYRQAYNSLRAADSRIASLRRQMSSADYWRKSNLRSQIAELRRRRGAYSSIMKDEIRKWNKPILENIEKLQEERSSKVNDIEQKREDLNRTQSQILDAQAKRTASIQKRDSLLNNHEETMKQGNHFIQKFEILEYAVGRKHEVCTSCNGKGKIKKSDPSTGMTEYVNCSVCNGSGYITGGLPTEWYFLWLIRLLFFIIELLPTVVKIVMPIGAYDRMLYSEERDMEKYLNSPEYLNRVRSMHDMEIKAHEEQLELQKKAEKEIREKVIEDLKNSQLQIAELAIKKWKDEELRKLDESPMMSVSSKHTGE